MSIQNDIAKAKEARSKALNQMANLAVKGKTNDPIYKSLENDADNYTATIDMLLQIEGSGVTDQDLREHAREREETRNAIAAIPNQIVSAFAKPDMTKKEFELFKRSLLTPHKLNEVEQRDITTLITPGGKDLISLGFNKSIQSAARTFGQIAELVRVVPGSYIKQPLADASMVKHLVVGTGEGSTVVAEPSANGANTYSQTPNVFSTTAQVNSIVATINASRQEFADADSLYDFLTNTVFAESLAASVESVLTTGRELAGTVVPSASSTLLASSATGATTSTLAAGIKYNDFISLFESFGTYAYISPDNPNARIFLHPSTKLYLQGQLDGFGRPFYSLDAQGNLVSIAGVQVAINNALPVYNASAPAAGQVVAVAGDTKRGLNYVQGSSTLTVLHERFLDQNLLSFVSEHRLGVTAGVTGAFKSLVLAAS